MTDRETDAAETLRTPSALTLATATIAAMAVAGVVLFTIVLPAEYGVDPFGTGALLGLGDLAGVETAETAGASEAVVTPPGPAGAHFAQPSAYKQDQVEFTIDPRQGMEYKYRIEQGGGLVYSWGATGPLHFEFHAEPDGSPRGYAESFDLQDDRDQGHGSYLAPFSGIHGWYWENRTDEAVTLVLSSAGMYSAALEFRPDADVRTRWFD